MRARRQARSATLLVVPCCGAITGVITSLCRPEPERIAMNDPKPTSSTGSLSRRAMLGHLGKAAAASVAVPSMLRAVILPATADAATVGAPAPVNGIAGVDRVVVLPGKTYLRAWAGYGEPPRPAPRRPQAADSTPPAPSGPPPTVRWRKRSGPGTVTFADERALTTTATFSETGVYVIELMAEADGATATSALTVKAEVAPPAQPYEVVHMRAWSIDSPLWNHRVKALIVDWI